MSQVSLIFTPAGISAGSPASVTFAGGAEVELVGNFVKVSVVAEGVAYYYNQSHVGRIKVTTSHSE